MKKAKIFIKPEAEMIEFFNDDIILTSGKGDMGGINYPWAVDEDFPDNPANF